MIRKRNETNETNDPFVNEVLQKWHSPMEGSEAVCTWKHLIESMKAAHLDCEMIKVIEDTLSEH